MLAPVISLTSALAAWAVVPFSDFLVIADVNAGLLYVLAMTSLGVYGVIIAGWASNSKYALLGAMRSAAQIVAYEIAMGFALVVVLMAAGSLNLREIVLAQEGGLVRWFWLPLLPMFAVYVISGIAETNRAPFDVAEGESEIVAGFHVEYSGMAFSVFFLAEYANMILISALTVIMFLGGWLSPLPGVGRMRPTSDGCSSPAYTGSSPSSCSSCSCTCGCAPPSRATATTRSCGSDGRSSFRSRSSGSWWSGSPSWPACRRGFDGA